MSSPPFDATIELAPRPSVRAVVWLFWLHAGVVLMVAAAGLPAVQLATFALLTGASWFWTRRHPVFGYGPRALTRLTWHAAGGWTLRDASGAPLEAELEGSSLVHGAMLVLNFRVKEGGWRSRALLGDELEEEPLRRLRARLTLLRAAR